MANPSFGIIQQSPLRIGSRPYLEIQDGDETIGISPRMQKIFENVLSRLTRAARLIDFSSEDCFLYKNGECLEGLACEYRHPGSEHLQKFVRKMDGICIYFFTQRGCSSWFDCPKEHLTFEEVGLRYLHYQKISKEYPTRFAPLED